VRRLGILETDEDGVLHGKAMVVGASGAIGSVCARLLALAADEIWLVSPETAKLLQIKREIEQEHPRADVHVATDPSAALPDMDMIVTATSAAGQKVLDIMRVKPGCVITDVARPLDLSPEDVAKRPDVLVIESGEVELPGEVHMKDIGLPAGVAYACLAETIVLALEGRYENFTVGRNISWPKVKEIYKLGLKHGMKLATISGVNGPYTDEDFDRVRTAALAANQYFWETDLQRDATTTIEVNTLAPMYVAHAFLPAMIEAPGECRLLNLASAAGFTANPRMAAYAASKWAVIGWSDSVRLELKQAGHDHVKVTTVCPYYTRTGMFEGAKSAPLLPILDPADVVDEAWKGTLAGRAFVVLPKTVQLGEILKGVVPTDVRDFLADRVFGVYHTMDDFTGRADHDR
jgi:short-subunit dehydrogenase